MRTIKKASDGRFYRNELCFDGTNGETIALRDIEELCKNEREKELWEQWKVVLGWAKKIKRNDRTDGYNPDLTYGVYQIYDELNKII